MKVLVVEDEIELANLIKKGLEESGFTIEICHDGEEGLYMATEYEFDAIVLDVNLPKINGFEILERIRKKNLSLPVLMLTAMGDVSYKIKGLNSGADDYISKPFDFDELIARLHAIIRRSKGKASPILNIDDLEINLNSKSVKRNNIEIKLSSREFNLLEYLALNTGRVISRIEISEHLYDFDTDSNVIDVYINYLRNKIDKGFKRELIKTIRGAGYILE
ncbi:MAG: response regulator transcription factor [Candidatus Sericytochromatia bacterium]